MADLDSGPTNIPAGVCTLMPIQAASPSDSGFTTSAPEKSNLRWAVCFLLFLATTINYMDRSVFSLIEPLLHLPFMGWIPGLDHTHQAAYDINYGRVLIAFQIAYGVGFLFAVMVFTLSVVSFPLLLDRDVGIIAAVMTSVRAVVANPAVRGYRLAHRQTRMHRPTGRATIGSPLTNRASSSASASAEP